MTDTESKIREIYSAFNSRDIDGCLARMTHDVDWPKASEGGRVIGKDEVRAYWTRQWAEFDPHVEPVHVAEASGKVAVGVHQIVRSMDGEVLFDGIVTHIYTLEDGLISRMEIGADAANEETFAFRR